MDLSLPGVLQTMAVTCRDSSAVPDKLKGVQQIQATEEAFAAILEDGSAITWGNANFGGDSSAVQDQLKGVQQIKATFYGAFAAILQDGSVVTWGHPDHGGDSSAVQDQLKGVQQIQATEEAFAAILQDGSVVTWGGADFGGDSSAVQDQLKGVQQIQATEEAFAAILQDGSVVTWGGADFGGDSSAVQDQLKGVQQIQARPQKRLLLRFCKMDLSLPGVLQTMAVTVRQFNRYGLCCDSARWICRYLGSCKRWRWQFGSSGSAQGHEADSWRLWRWQFGSSKETQVSLVSWCMPEWKARAFTGNHFDSFWLEPPRAGWWM